MSNVSDVLDVMRLKLATLFPDKLEMSNPYSLEQNQSIILENAYGVKVGPASLVEGEFCNYSSQREIGIILTAFCPKTDADSTPFIETTKSLLDDANTVVGNFMANNQLDVENKIRILDFTNDSGISFVYGEKYSYLYIELSFNLTTSEVYP